ncbi:hypothetical protein L218DRAFT_946590 [Marasmius fiardii PR-910]|nr:hypothetical protein L218DRAFT_946590 [Marasmius fiardii PR-910]
MAQELGSSTPYKSSATAQFPLTSTHYEYNECYGLARRENRGHYVQINTATFLEMFFPGQGASFQPVPGALVHLNKIPFKDPEVKWYEHLIRAFELYCPQLKFIDSSSLPTESKYGRPSVQLKPDISSYFKSELSAPSALDPPAPSPAPPVTKRAVNFEKVEVIIETRAPRFERDSEQGGSTRGRITMYGIAQLAEQHRTHCFSVVIVERYARLIWWNRAGAVVTPRFDYFQDESLAKFFHLYASAAPDVRGLDTSASTSDEHFDERYPQWQKDARERLSPDPTKPLSDDHPLFLFDVRVRSDVQPESVQYKKFVGTTPFIRNTHSLTGRSTRCYRVWDAETKQVQFMKDTWRSIEPGVMEEGEIYEALKKENVRNILTLVTYGDVVWPGTETYQITKTQTFLPEESNLLKRLKGRYHTRLVFKECGKSITQANSIGEMVSAIYDSILDNSRAHKDAYENAQYLHRDISVGNIIILPDGRGCLIDWDLAKSRQELEKTPRQLQRTQFISGRLLDTQVPIKHVLADDLESYYHVLAWLVALYVQHERVGGQLLSYLKTFDEVLRGSDPEELSQGGLYKTNNLASKFMSNTKLYMNDPEPLKKLLRKLEETLSVRYGIEPTPGQIVEAEAYRIELFRNPSLVRSPDFFDRILCSLEVTQCNVCKQNLTSHAWFEKIFHEATALKSRMPDPLVYNLPGVTTTYKPPRRREAFDNSDEFWAAGMYCAKKRRREEQ